ncbi:MAG: hypothetical protein J6C85_05415, partial [Alphaproteobacteria bacterium]|nr:hypothetical protein [Alphaproteobacteria bacterium]
RSMIEMLGVLAIVGILSIGGISAFQKAMTKHKINQTTEEFSQYITEILRYSADFRKMHKNNTSTQFVGIAGASEFFLPTKWIRKGSYLYDSMKNEIWPSIRNDLMGPTRKFLNLGYTLTYGKNKSDLCVALYNLSQSYTDSIYKVSVYHIKGDGGDFAYMAMGNIYCTSGKKCLKDITPTEMVNNCQLCMEDDKGCSFVFTFPL